ncbi:MAG: hypothetical protein PVH77_03355 [Phycisphaerales bacterium]|jgi:hypothetical protein
MDENKTKLKLDALRGEIRERVKVFAEALIAELQENLQSLTIVGSSLTEDFRTGQSDINTVLVLGKIQQGPLKRIAKLAKPMSKKKISPPLLMTTPYIERSLDVFGIEFLEFQLAHQTILGDDPFGGLSISKKDVRLQCERELKAMLIRLRQGFIASGGNRKLVRDILISTTKGLLPLLRAMLWLKDVERTALAEDTLNKASSELSINIDSLKKTLNWRSQKTRLGEFEMEQIFQSIYSTAEQLALIVDKLEV